MPKLRLKRTPEEEAAHQLRKQQRKEAKRKRKYAEHDYHSEKRHRPEPDQRPWASSDEELPPHPVREPGSSNHINISENPDYERIRAELEEQRFREKMFEAFEDDERLDSLEARLNDFAHVPGRWRTDGSKPGKAAYDDHGFVGDDFLKADPRHMDDEEYAEWVRAGMYRKTHADEYAEQQRKKALKAQRREEVKARRLEAQRLEKIAEEDRRLRKLERADKRRKRAREEYEHRWTSLLSAARGEDKKAKPQELRLYDIPWPVLAAYERRRESTTGPVTITMEHLTTDAILEFLVPPSSRSMADPAKVELDKRERKEKLRETVLRFHPDKFEGRFMKLIKENEKEAVREAIGQVVRSLNTLMNDMA
ncbi:hypothetical protein H0H87_008239 [Tephrocybe sp. NHM501043]|nr:hypothetical protein H0H87_008239 [Tephrocybe sp. NHM501043]